MASILISLGLMIGFPQAIDKDNLPKSVKIYDEKIQVVQVLPDSPAMEAGLQSSDSILKIDGQVIKDEKDMFNLISGSQNESINLMIDRSGEIKEFEITPKISEDTGQKIIGVAFSQTGVIKYPWYQAIWEGIKMTGYLIWAILYAFYEIIRNLIVGQPAGVEVAGPIGIADLTGQMARMGFIYLIQFTALLSINLAIINILPFPALDGGRLLFLLIEKIKGSPVKQEVEAIFHNLGFVLLMALVVWVTFKDILKLFS
ncbi:MAG: RIP metalloprotease RseP [Clostridia bacterium]|nr:RIP metalloprotease RseP [Clostridia bacterium]